jgi:hypothetical protein
MPDLDQIKQEKQGGGDGRGRFPKVRSATPLAGRVAPATRAAISRGCMVQLHHGQDQSDYGCDIPWGSRQAP